MSTVFVLIHLSLSCNEIFSKLVEQKIDDAHSKEKSNASLIEDSARSDPDEPEYTNPDKQSLILLKDLGEKTQHSIEHASVDKQNNTFDLFLPSKTDDIEDLIHENGTYKTEDHLYNQITDRRKTIQELYIYILCYRRLF